MKYERGAQQVSTQLYQISLLSGYGNLDNQCRDPMNNNKDCRVGQLTTIYATPGMCGTGKLGDAFTSGFEFPFTTNPTKWDNEYFVNLERYQVGNH